MDTDFISAVCPNCGGKLKVDPSADTLTCQFCGTEHIIRRNVGGTVTLEAYARCPSCQRNDRSEKVSAILKNQTSQSQGVVSQQKLYTDAKGNTHIKTENVPVQTTQTSDLARRLAPPPRPTLKPKGVTINGVLIVAIIMLVLGAVVQRVVFIILAIGLFVLWFFLRMREGEKTKQSQVSNNDAEQQWNLAMSRWEKLYYCGRDDIIFIPGEKTSSNVSDIHTYLYTDPAVKVLIPPVNSTGGNNANSLGEKTVNSSVKKNNIMFGLSHKIGSFWKTGKNGKFISIVAAILIIISLCCAGTITLNSILPKSAATSTPIPPIINTLLPTSTSLPINTVGPTNTPVPTLTPSITFTPLPSGTLTAIALYASQTSIATNKTATQAALSAQGTATREAYSEQLTATQAALSAQRTATREAYSEQLTATQDQIDTMRSEFPDGNYLVNVDIAPGVWRNDGSATTDNNCYWVSTTETGDIIRNYFGAGNGTAYIGKTDFQFSSNNCGIWTFLSPP
jgi:predicted RNA-binding Zn-ribbon protein involved in translation (DUF1610 family)